MNDTSLKVVADVHNILGESPVWDDVKRVLWWVDLKQQKLFRLCPENGAIDEWVLPRQATALTIMGDGKSLLLACPGALMRFNVRTGDVIKLAAFEGDLPGNRPNDGKCDPAGRFWLGSMDDGEAPGKGGLYRIDAELKPVRLLDKLTIPNTLAWSPDKSTFYFADSAEQTIWAFDFDEIAGSLSNRRVFVSLKGTELYPDGSTIDAEGYLWNAQWMGWRVVRYAPDGSVDRIIDMPVACPTSCMFGGDGLKTLYITTARHGQSSDALAKQPHAGSLFALNTEVNGLPTTPFCK